MGSDATPERTYLGVDVGGTKILAALADEAGVILERCRVSTPRDCPREETLAAITDAIAEVLDDAKDAAGGLQGIGIAIPGVVEPSTGRVVVTPNMNLGGLRISRHLSDRFEVPVSLGNDCDFGALGENWLGAARGTRSAVGIFVGTGIGGGYVRKGKVLRGARDAAMEVGHMIVQIGGPECGCGNLGCLEALASRTAIERDLRRAVEGGRESALGEILDGDFSRIRSRVLKKALKQGDELTREVLTRAAEVLGYGCLSVRHLLDPDVIVLGGGVFEACGEFMLPIVQDVLARDKLSGARDSLGVRLAALEDDAVVLGAVAAARTKAGRSPFMDKYAILPDYPRLTLLPAGGFRVADETKDRDITLRADGKVKKAKIDEEPVPRPVDAKQVAKACTGAPAVLFLGTGAEGQAELTDEARRYLELRGIEYRELPTREAVEAYMTCDRRKAAVMCLPS